MKKQLHCGAKIVRAKTVRAKMVRAKIIGVVCLCPGLLSAAHAQTRSQISNPTQKENIVAHHASGTFDVKLNPQTSYEESIGRMSLDKQFHGDLEATSQGEFLGAYGSVKGSAGYVAMEKVSGILKGKSGAFVLQHSGTMTHGEQKLSVTVVPDSGTGQLAGLQGAMTIKIEDGKHFYEFEYTLGETK